jgi:hypothetical protein
MERMSRELQERNMDSLRAKPFFGEFDLNAHTCGPLEQGIQHLYNDQRGLCIQYRLTPPVIIVSRGIGQST